MRIDLNDTSSGSSGENSNPDLIMPFGKHKGLHLSEIPTDYLKWLTSGELSRLDPDLKAAAEVELWKRVDR